MPMNDFNQGVIEEFRANQGRVGGMFEGMPILLLHHTGARTGTRRVTPLAYLEDGDRYAIVASKGGAPAHPDWYHNLKANPRVEIEVGTDTFEATAEELEGDERDRLYAEMARRLPSFGEYAQKTSRVIPVFALTPVRLEAERDIDPSV
jgi:deazaflavin-dependent oxidoreductase (nitroreductase family)